MWDETGTWLGEIKNQVTESESPERFVAPKKTGGEMRPGGVLSWQPLGPLLKVKLLVGYA